MDGVIKSITTFMFDQGMFFLIWGIVAIGGWLLKIFLCRKFKTKALQTHLRLDDAFFDLLEQIKALDLVILGLYLALINSSFPFGEVTNEKLSHVLFVWVLFILLRLTFRILNFILESFTTSKNKTAIYGIRILLETILVAIVVLVGLSYLGVNISALVASMGIGGIAIALAAQNIFSDLFASFTIYFDKPFQIGDFVTIGTDSGTVKKIGLKSTRIETLQGEELIVSNQDLTSSRIQNFKKLKKRRTTFRIEVIYETDNKLLKTVPTLLKTAIESPGEQKVEFLWGRFIEFGGSGLVFEGAYYTLTDVYTDFLETQEIVNFAIKEALDDAKIEFAYPTVLVKK